MVRLLLTKVMESKLENALNQIGVYRTDNRTLFVEAVLYRIRTGSQWRDLPEAFGPWKTVYNRFNTWSRSGIWERLFRCLKKDPDFEWIFIDGSYVKAHQHSSGGVESPEEKTIGKSRGGLTTKIHMVVDAHGNPIHFKLTSGNVHDTTQLPCLVDEISGAENIICDKGYDSASNREAIESSGAVAHIPLRKGSRRENLCFDSELYKHRHLVENLFARIKHFRGVASRFDKLTRNYFSVVSIACMFIWLKL